MSKCYRHCSRCGKRKILSEKNFYRAIGYRDGFKRVCIACLKEYDKQWYKEGGAEKCKARAKAHWDEVCADKRKYNHSEKGKVAQKKYVVSDKGKKSLAKASKSYRERFPNKNRARQLTLNAKRHGLLTPPNRCSKCGKRRKVQAHHPDYSNPLLVAWLCKKQCHYQAHGKLI